VHLLVERGSVRVAEHLIKALNFKGVSLEHELNPYYFANFGFLTYSNFLNFLQQTGLVLKDYEKDIQEFMEEHSLRHQKAPFDPKIFLCVHQLEETLVIAKSICHPAHNFSRDWRTIRNKDIEDWKGHSGDLNASLT
jgi:hypothetical protein